MKRFKIVKRRCGMVSQSVFRDSVNGAIKAATPEHWREDEKTPWDMYPSGFDIYERTGEHGNPRWEIVATVRKSGITFVKHRERESVLRREREIAKLDLMNQQAWELEKEFAEIALKTTPQS